MRIGRHLFHHPCHFANHLVIRSRKDKYLSDRVFVLKILPGNTFGDDHLAGHGKASGLISFHQLEIEQAEETGIGISYLVFAQSQFTVLHYLLGLIQRDHPGIVFNSGQILFHSRTITKRTAGPIVGLYFAFIESAFHTENALVLLVHLVETELKSDISQYQQGRCHADCQSENIDETESFPFHQVTIGTIPIIPYHTLSVLVPEVSSSGRLIFSATIFPSSRRIIRWA